MTTDRLSKLIELTARLRGPEGCPWDRAQSYDSLSPLLLQEACEVIDAAAERDFASLRDELGDLLFQVLFYCRLAEEEQKFDLDDVLDHVHAKLIRRHPHVFGEKRARTAEEALASWQAVKAAERNVEASGEVSASASLLDGIPHSAPSTLEAYELGVRAARSGFDWPSAGSLLDKIQEEIAELHAEMKAGKAQDSDRLREEAGDLLFAAANLARYLHSDPETCLRRANRKFKRRFQTLEARVREQGKSVSDCQPGELDALWEEIKRSEHD